jgi:hypothetical protein
MLPIPDLLVMVESLSPVQNLEPHSIVEMVSVRLPPSMLQVVLGEVEVEGRPYLVEAGVRVKG